MTSIHMKRVKRVTIWVMSHMCEESDDLLIHFNYVNHDSIHLTRDSIHLSLDSLDLFICHSIHWTYSHVTRFTWHDSIHMTPLTWPVGTWLHSLHLLGKQGENKVFSRVSWIKENIVLKSYVSFAEDRLFYRALLRKRPIPYLVFSRVSSREGGGWFRKTWTKPLKPT